MHERRILALATILAACGPQVEPVESEDTEAQDASSESGSTGRATSDATAPSASGSTAPGTTDASSSTTSTGPDSTSGPESTSDGETTEGLAVSCECLIEDGPFLYPGCDLDELCDPIVVGCELEEPSECAFEDLTVLDPAVLECHRDALLAGEAGMLRWELPYPPDAGAAGQRGWVVLPGEGTALFWRESWGAGSYAFSAVEGAPLDDAATLGCGALGTPEAMLPCLYAPTTDDVVTCNEAYEFPIG